MYTNMYNHFEQFSLSVHHVNFSQTWLFFTLLLLYNALRWLKKARRRMNGLSPNLARIHNCTQMRVHCCCPFDLAVVERKRRKTIYKSHRPLYTHTYT